MTMLQENRTLYKMYNCGLKTDLFARRWIKTDMKSTVNWPAVVWCRCPPR